MAALVTLVALFVGCYALPPLLPYSYSELDFTALQTPPSPQHWFGTNALGQDVLAQVLRGMQKSMLIGVCVAVISTLIAATVGAIAGYFGGWRDRALMWFVDLVLVLILVCANLTGDGLRDAFDPGSANLRARRHPKKST